MATDDETTAARPTDDEAILHEARRRFRLVADGEAAMRERMLDDQRFRAGEQWAPEVKLERLAAKRPMLTIDKLRQPIRQITNQQRQSRLAIDIHPKGGEATEDDADMLQGLIRHIEVQSVAEVAYSWAFEAAATIGRGYWRVLTEWSNDDDDDQDIVIKRVLNPFCVYVDLACIEPDYSDMRYALIVEDLDPEEFAARYPDAEPASAEVYRSLGDDTPRWLPGGKVRVAEYWRVVEEPRPGGPGGRAHNRRKVQCFHLSGAEVLERYQWAGRYIPIVPCIGEELDVDGERILQGIVRPAKDPQRMYNYWTTAQTEMIALAKMPAWLIAEGQDEGHPEWATANTLNHAVLRYKPTSLAGAQVPPPSRNFAEPPIQAITIAIGQANEDLKGTTGVYDPSLGRLSPSERSGKAIQALQMQGQTANSNYLDNLARSITYTGKILVDLIPKIYGRPGRVARLLGEDDKATTVVLNAPYMPTPNGPQLVQAPPGTPPGTAPQPGQLPPGAKFYNLEKGQYSVTVSVGPGYQTRRQEGASAIEMLIQANPALAPLVADVWVDSLEFPGHRTIAKRLKKALPPQLQDETDGQPQVPPQVQQYIQQLEGQHQQLGQLVEKMAQTIETEQIKTQMQGAIKSQEMQARERIEAMKIQADLIKTEATINAKAAQALIGAELARIQQQLDQMFEAQQGAAGQAYEADQAERQRQHEAALGMMQGAGAAARQGQSEQHETDLQAAEQGHEQRMAALAPAEPE